MASLHLGQRLQYLCCSHSLSKWLLRFATSIAWLHSLQRLIIGQEEQRCLSRKLSSSNLLSNCLQQSQQYSGFWACFLVLVSGLAFFYFEGFLQTTTFQMTPPSSSIFCSIILIICGFRCYSSGWRFQYPISRLILAIKTTAAMRISLFLSSKNLLQNYMMTFLDLPIVYLAIMRESMLSLPMVIFGSFSLRDPLEESHRRSQQSYLLVRGCAGSETITSSHVYLSFSLLWPKQSVNFCKMYWIFLDAAPMAFGLNFFITIPKKSTVDINTVMILSLINFLVTNKAARIKSYAYFLSSLSVLLKFSLIIYSPFYLQECYLESRYQKVTQLKTGKYLLHSSTC